MNTVPHFLLGIPIQYKGICAIHPMPIGERIAFDDQHLASIFLPYVITDAMLGEKVKADDIFSLILSDTDLFSTFCESLTIFCKAESVRLDQSRSKLFIDSNQEPLESSTFPAFAKIVREWNCISEFKKEEEPVFETEAGREQWLKLKKHRAQRAKAEDDILGSMINVVQFGGNSYIDESAILKWSYWKLANAYHAIIGNREYEHAFGIYLQSGKRELVKQHWTEQVKPKAKY